MAFRLNEYCEGSRFHLLIRRKKGQCFEALTALSIWRKHAHEAIKTGGGKKNKAVMRKTSRVFPLDGVARLDSVMHHAVTVSTTKRAVRYLITCAEFSHFLPRNQAQS